jgi:plasmid stabilization system protein ParE
MDYQIEWSPEAVEGIEEIAAYIRKDSPIYAQKVVEELISATRRLNQLPLRGRNECDVLIVAVIHGKRQIELVERFNP